MLYYVRRAGMYFFLHTCRYVFLALLNYVSKAHEIAICPSSVVGRPSSVRVAMISELNARISFKF